MRPSSEWLFKGGAPLDHNATPVLLRMILIRNDNRSGTGRQFFAGSIVCSTCKYLKERAFSIGAVSGVPLDEKHGWALAHGHI
jgi:hypothetical protein